MISETSTEYKTLESLDMLDISVGHVKSVTSYKGMSLNPGPEVIKLFYAQLK